MSLDRKSSHLLKLRISTKGDRSAVGLVRLDKFTVTLPTGSNCAANSTTEININLPVSASTPAAPAGTYDFIEVNPVAAMPAGLTIAACYILTAGTAALGNILNPSNTPTAAVMAIRFQNQTGAVIDAAGGTNAGVYNVLLFRG